MADVSVNTSLLIGDLGGTNARFALAEPQGPGFTAPLTLAAADFETPDEAIAAYLERTGVDRPAVICLAAAGAIVDDTVRFLNSHWVLDGRRLGEVYPAAKVHLVNDFEANAWCIPMLSAADLEPIGIPEGGIESKADFSVGVLGPGTGLGIAGLICRNGVSLPMTGEGGHMGFAPETGVQIEILRLMRERYERVSQERILSGQGLQNIYACMLRLHNLEGRTPEPGDIFSRALAGDDVVASETVQLFFEILGQVAGNLVLALGAWDGLYIAGGIVRRYPDLLKSSMFRSGFENKGRYRSLMERVPTYLITHDEPGLLGAAHVARQISDKTSRETS